MIVAVSGGFDPLHKGHVYLIEEAAKYGSVVVILNNDNWLMQKKGSVFMPQQDRKTILKAMRNVIEVMVTMHEEDPADRSVVRELQIIRPDYFANGGDRTRTNTPEMDWCYAHNVTPLWNVGGEKVASSSELVQKALRS